MNTWYDNNRTAGIAALLAEDAGAPELRNPRHSAMRSFGWLTRIFGGRRA